MNKPISRNVITSMSLGAALLLLSVAGLCYGPVNIPFANVFGAVFGNGSGNAAWDYIIRESRFPSVVTAILAGSALSASGLMLQTVFRNPLAGPDILGINGGAGLGVALVMMAFGGNLSMGSMSLGTSVSVIIGATTGAFAVTGLILLLSARIKNPAVLLIAGVMVSYLTSALISLLNFFSTAEGVHSYTMWGMGNFAGVSLSRLPLFTCIALAGLVVAFFLSKPLNAMLLGDLYAENLGINTKRVRLLLLFATSMLVAVTTAFCGPISFIGLAVPHLARLVIGTANHRSLMTVTVLTGAVTALLCNIVSSLPGNRGLIPLNAITPAVGAPVILYVLLKQERKF